MSTAERIKLSFPIEHDGVPIGDIALRRPTVATTSPRRSRLGRTPSERFG